MFQVQLKMYFYCWVTEVEIALNNLFKDGLSSSKTWQFQYILGLFSR